MENLTCETENHDLLMEYYESFRIGSDVPAYHITPKKNLDSIAKVGLVGSCGERSSLLNEPFSVVYMFTTLELMEDALGGWLGECFDETEELSVFEVDVQGLKLYSEVEWEIIYAGTISPDRLTFLREE